MPVPLLRRLRQHHAIEHATVAVLFERRGRFPIVGMADPGGFHIIAAVIPEDVTSAATEALQRLQRGQSHLAVSDLCGGNILVTSALVATATLAATGSRRWRELPTAIALGAVGVMAAPIFGRLLQRRYTTEPRVDTLRVAGVKEIRHAGTRRHYRVRVTTVEKPGTAR